MTKQANKKKQMEQVFTDAEAKRAELEQKYKSKVNMAVLAVSADEEPCIAYFRSATTFTKMQCIDLSMQSPMKASATMFEATVIREATDPRVFRQDNDNDAYYLGALQYCGEVIEIAHAYLKKK